LVPQGYRIILAKNGQDALELFEKRQQEIDIVLLDVVMPGMSGPDVYSAMLAIRPNLPVVFTTGHTSEAVSLHSKLEAGAVFLPKPYTLQALRQAIRTALDRSKTRSKRNQVKARNSPV